MKQSTSHNDREWAAGDQEPPLCDQVAEVVKVLVFTGDLARGHRCHIRWRATAPKEIGGRVRRRVVVDIIDLES